MKNWNCLNGKIHFISKKINITEIFCLFKCLPLEGAFILLPLERQKEYKCQFIVPWHLHIHSSDTFFEDNGLLELVNKVKEKQ